MVTAIYCLLKHSGIHRVLEPVHLEYQLSLLDLMRAHSQDYTKLNLLVLIMNGRYYIRTVIMYHIAQNFGGGEFWRIWWIHLSQPKIFPAKFLNMTMYTIHNKPVALGSPNFSSPIACLATNCQKLTLPKFCTIRYIHTYVPY